MDDGQKVLIAAVLACGCAGISLYELIKRMEVSITIGKLVALAIGVVYFVIACFAGPQATGGVLMCLVLPLGMIWFSEELGAMTGMSIRGSRVDKALPAFLIRLFGWFFLLLPIALWIWFSFAMPSR